MSKKLWSALLSLSLVVLIIIVITMTIVPTQASPPTQTPEPAGVTISYPGALTDATGQPAADGAYDFTFALYAAPEGGEPLWTETQTAVPVAEGAFVTLLGNVNSIPKQVLDSGAQWLAVSVRGPADAEFTTLNPRQELSAAAAPDTNLTAASSCAHTHMYETWVGGDAGYAGYILRVENKSNGDGFRANAIARASYAAVRGINVGAGSGVDGSSTTGYGVRGVSTSNYGVYGSSTSGRGVQGESSTNYGVTGSSTDAHGMRATSTKKSGIWATGGEWGVIAEGNDTSNTDALGDLRLMGDYGEIFATGHTLNLYSNRDVFIDLDNNNNDSNACLKIYNGADVVVSQTCENGTKSAVLRTAEYGQRAVYVVESPEVWLEDYASAKLVNGEATVPFEPIFAQTINRELDYHVFVTPLCQEPVLLFVTAKTAEGFTVKGVTLDNKPANCAFDYHIVAKRLGLENLRLELVENIK